MASTKKKRATKAFMIDFLTRLLSKEDDISDSSFSDGEYVETWTSKDLDQIFEDARAILADLKGKPKNTSVKSIFRRRLIDPIAVRKYLEANRKKSAKGSRKQRRPK